MINRVHPPHGIKSQDLYDRLVMAYCNGEAVPPVMGIIDDNVVFLACGSHRWAAILTVYGEEATWETMLDAGLAVTLTVSAEAHAALYNLHCGGGDFDAWIEEYMPDFA